MANKPDWKDAPDWATVLVQDKDGVFWWYEEAPDCHGGYWESFLRREQAYVNASMEIRNV